MFNIEKNTSGSSAIDVKEILENILKSDISTKIADLPQKWQSLVLACLERDAQKRVKNEEKKTNLFDDNETKSTITETKIIEREILKTVIIDTTKTVIVKHETSLPKKKNNLKFWIGSIAILGLIAIGAFLLNNTKKSPEPIDTIKILRTLVEKPFVKPVVVVDSAIVPTKEIVEEKNDWKKEFETKYATIKEAEKKNTNEVNQKRYNELLTSLPKE